MDTPDSLLICTAPFILIRRSGWSQPILPGTAGERLPLPLAARWEASPGGQEQPWLAGGGTRRGSTPRAGEAMSMPDLRLNGRDAALVSPPLSRSVGAGFVDTCLCGQALWGLADEVAGGWLGIRAGGWHCWLLPPARRRCCATEGKRWYREPAHGDKGQHYRKKSKLETIFWLKTFSQCMQVLVLYKQTYSKAVRSVTESNIQKVAKLIIHVAPPCF